MLSEPLHGVVVSVGYADFLDVALRHNRPMLSHCVVVTAPDDKETQQVAGKYACELIVTEDGARGGGFNKGALIERGLTQLPSNGWRVHFDADIVFPGNMRQRLGAALYDQGALYGCDRINAVNWESYQRLVEAGFTSRGFQYQHYLAYPLAGCDVGSRLVFHDQGWCPIGFFQLWHHTSEYSGLYRTRGYAVGSNNAAHDDVQFALRWDRSKRILIPEFFVAHLCTDDMHYAANWKGRKTESLRERTWKPGHLTFNHV